ncbi:hypothetical protein [uncultured Ruminococcus sp.]|uniref:hypothetical protein n=1 Tax=uncultured Ruminococcus sp. TaxID=165186 RepID=UPI000EE36A37|nr:hypothetical protein [uncultured Ruminococcus sp.]HCJ42103.1 hypothetical protein [Ruminococcus sp.]
MLFSLQLFIRRDGRTFVEILDNCLEFSFEKALYVPYNEFRGVFYEDGAPTFTAGEIIKVMVTADAVPFHEGMPDEVSVERRGSGYRVRVKSRSYTLLLAQNQPYPRINTNVTLRSLCEANLTCSEISYENPTPTVGNIYVNEGSTVWEAAVAYCIKASGNYPFIRGSNIVRMTASNAAVIDYSGENITAQTCSVATGALLSDVYMKELGDTYPFEAHDTSAADMKIVRARYYPLDMQWLYDPQVGLQHKLDYSNKAVRTVGMTYEGWKSEELMDIASGGGDISGKRINRIRTVGSKRGVFTTVTAYIDRYGQRQEGTK